MRNIVASGYDRGLLIFSLLRRVGLGVGSFLAIFPYFNQSMDTDSALAIGIGVGLVAFCLPPVGGRDRPLPLPPRGFEVVVPERPGD